MDAGNCDESEELGDFGPGVPITFKQRLRPGLGYRLPKTPGLMIVFDYKKRTWKRYGNGLIELFYCHECLSVTDGNLADSPMVYVCNEQFISDPEKPINRRPHRCVFMDVGTTLGSSRFYELKFELRFAPTRPWPQVVEEELQKIDARTDLNEDEKMNMRAAFLKKKPREYHRRGLTTKNGVNPQNHIKLKRIIDADENSEMAQGGVDDSQQPKRCKVEAVSDEEEHMETIQSCVMNYFEREIMSRSSAVPSTSYSTLVCKEPENFQDDPIISHVALFEFGRGIPLMLKPTFRPALVYRLRGSPNLAVAYSYGFTSKRRSYRGNPLERYYCFECSRRKRRCPSNLYPTPPSAVVANGMFLTDPENPPNGHHFCRFLNFGEALGNSRYAELCSEMKNSPRSWKDVIDDEIIKVNSRTDLTEEDKHEMLKTLVCKSSSKVEEANIWFKSDDVQHSVSLDVVKLEPIDEEMLRVRGDTSSVDTGKADCSRDIIEPISDRLFEALNAVVPTVRRSHMTLCALEKLDIGWKDLVAEICRKLETMPVAAQEEMLFSVRVMVANLENTFNIDRLKKISEDMWPAVLSKIDAKAVVEHTKKFEQIVFELNTYTNRNFRCPVCGNYFTQKPSVERHLQRVHFTKGEKGEIERRMVTGDEPSARSNCGRYESTDRVPCIWECLENENGDEKLKIHLDLNASSDVDEVVYEPSKINLMMKLGIAQNGSRSKMKQRAVGGKQSRDSKMLEFPEFEATLTKALEDVKPIQNRSHLLIRILEKMSVTRKQLVDRIAEALIAMPSIFRDETLSQILEMFASKSTTKWDQDTLL